VNISPATASPATTPAIQALKSRPAEPLAAERDAHVSTPRSRRGFTLTELLAVVGIVAMILALLTPALMGARRTAMNAKVKAEIDLLHIALMNYKNEYGAFPPANMAGLWTGSQVNQQHPVYRHLVRAFPRIREPTSGNSSPYFAMSQLSPAQALVFWLRGFYENPEFPLTNNLTNKGQRRKLFDFDESRLYGVVGAYVHGGSAHQSFVARKDLGHDSPEYDYPVYFTGLPRSGLPYIYFDSRCYDVENSDFVYSAMSLGGGEISFARPYFTSAPPMKPLWSQRHVNSDTFQLIAAGLDGNYGQVKAAFPYDIDPFKSAGTLPGHGDNITNFAPKPLAEAISGLNVN
jgi:prepilin-type N-terminal cleavage/methylation domain-containing protein